MYNVGLVLSGGGARGVAHLGLIKALEERDIKIDIISGTSAGAIIGAFYANGYSTNDILKILLEIKPFRLFQPSISKKGLLSMSTVNNFLKRYLPENSFDKLNIPLYIAATDIKKGEITYFNEGELITPICASSCIPVMFNPIEYNSRWYIDGGILNNLPAEPIRDQCKILIGSHTNPIDNDFDIKSFPSLVERSLMLAITRNAYQSANLCDFLVEPVGVSKFKVLDISKATDIFRLGYQTAIKFIDDNGLDKK